MIALVLGLVGGGIVGYFVSSSSGSSSGEALAEEHVAYACSIVERLDEEQPNYFTDSPIRNPVFGELESARGLFITAALLDEEYTAFTELGQNVIHSAQRFEQEEVQASVSEHAEQCQAL